MENNKRCFNEIEQRRMERKGTSSEVKSIHGRILQESQKSYKNYRLFTGFRATLPFTISLHSGNPDVKILELIYKNLESKLAYSIIWKWKFFKDFTNIRQKQKKMRNRRQRNVIQRKKYLCNSSHLINYKVDKLKNNSFR